MLIVNKCWYTWIFFSVFLARVASGVVSTLFRVTALGSFSAFWVIQLFARKDTLYS